jgi:RNA polymerase sigma-70 factor (ECF subfamily)
MQFANNVQLDETAINASYSARHYALRLRHEVRPVLPDRGGFERVVVPLIRNLRAAALRLTKNRPDADDLVQETVLRAWRFWPRYMERDNCRAWLQRILTNTFRTEWRRAARARVKLLELELHSASGCDTRDQSSNDRGFDTRERDALGLDDQLNSALSALKPDQRRVLWLIDVRERSYREAAAELACPIGTVMSRLHRARAALRLQLGASRA